MDPIETPRPRTSVSAILSLIFGLLGCIPFLTSLVALILGIVGIRKTRDPMVTGRGVAITGVVLGSLGLIGWAITTVTFGGAILVAYRVAEPARATAEQFARDLSQGNIDAALGRSVEGQDRASLEALAAVMKPWGECRGLSLNAVNLKANDDAPAEFTIGGTASFASESRPYSCTLRKAGDTYKVKSFDLK